MAICELTIRVDPDTVSCANICREPSSLYHSIFSLPFSKWMIINMQHVEETVFIFDLDVLQPSYMHFAYDAHTRLEASTLTPLSYVS